MNVVYDAEGNEYLLDGNGQIIVPADEAEVHAAEENPQQKN